MIEALFLTVLAATPIDLGQVRAEARHNAQALTAALEALRTSDLVRQARAGLLPHLSLSVSGGYEFEGTHRLLEPVYSANSSGTGATIVGLRLQDIPFFSHPNVTAQASLNQLLFDLGQFAALSAAGAQAAAAEAQSRETLDWAEYEAIRRFYVLLEAQRTAAVLESNRAQSAEFVERARALFDAGRGNRGDVLAAEVNANNDQAAMLTQASGVAQAQADLAGWLGRPETEDLQAVDPGMAAVPEAAPALDEVIAQAYRTRPLLQVVQQQLRAAQDTTRSAFGALLPRLSVRAAYTRYGNGVNPVFSDFSLQNDLTALLYLQWDIFSGGGDLANLNAAQRLESEAEITAGQTARDVEGALRVARTSLVMALELYRLAQATQRSAAEGLEFAKDRFTAGTASTLEVRDAQLKLTQAQLNDTHSRILVEVARAALQRMEGTLR